MNLSYLLTWLILLLSLIPLLPIPVCSSHASLVSGRCQGHQQSLLLQLKHDLIFDETVSEKLASWNASTECCEWPGIRCDPDGLGCVVTLDLSAEFISGGLNSKALFSLNHLQALDLSNNQDLRTTIPAELANLTHLRYLNLSNAGFFGQIPAAISRLTGLTSLDLSYQDGDLKLENPNLYSLVHNLTQLTDLRLDEVDLSAQGKEWCHALSSSLPNLRVLSLYNCLLSGPIDPSLSKLDSLSILQLDENNFSSPVPDSFAELKSLTSLTLSNCELVGTFPAEILQIQSLKTLDASANKFLQGVLPDFPQSHSMEVLNLGETSFNGVLPPSISNLKDLTLIDVSKCNFSGTIPKTLESSTQLESLDFSSNNFTGSIPRFIFELERLSYLSLPSNRFNGSVELSWIQTLQNLTFLDLSYNNLTVNAGSNNASASSLFPQLIELCLISCNVKTFPELGNQSSLLVLDLSDNNINGVVPRWILESTTLQYVNISHNNLVGLEVQHISPFETLDMHDNQLQGNLPIVPSWWSYIDFSNNHFHGSILTEIFSNLDLAFLSLSNNSLTGTIPTSVCDVVNLQILDLSNNHLNGTIPSCLMKNLTNLSVIDLRGNMLSGKIPDTFQPNNSLKILDLGNNQLQGKVPKTLENCITLKILDLGNNKISDVFPCFERIKSTLRVVILRSNLFHGQIWCSYDHLGTWKRLQIVDLAFNNFTGPLNTKYLATWEGMMVGGGNRVNEPIKFGTMNDLYYQDSISLTSKGHQMEFVKILAIVKSIDFSSNNFDGPIPEVIGKFKALYALNFSHNAFSGQIPNAFGNLSSLESLDLSDNNLSGHIPKELASLTFISALNLSNDHLVGSIPTGSQFQTLENTAFGGNPDLCGQPLSKSCTVPPAPPKIIVGDGKSATTRIDWDLLSKIFGYVFGLGLIMLPASLWPSFRVWYWPKIDSVILWMFPKFYVKDWNNHLRKRRSQRVRRGTH